MAKMKRMNKNIKARWLNALRGPRYLQGTGALRFGNRFCCLGVLSDLHAKETFLDWDYDENTGLYRYLGETVMLPSSVCEWAGIGNPNPPVLKVELSTHNDSRKLSFERIGRLIERHL